MNLADLLNLTPGGRSHRILAHLKERNGHFGHLARAAGEPEHMSASRRKKFWRLLDRLMAEGLIARDDKWFQLLPNGDDTLQSLNRMLGYDVRDHTPRASVRVFAREART
jgi:hypothetical protein